MKVKIHFKDGITVAPDAIALHVNDTGAGLEILFTDNAQDLFYNYQDFPIKNVEVSFNQSNI